MGKDSAKRLSGVTLPRKGLPDPIANGAILGDAAADVGNIDAPDKGLIMRSEDEKGHSQA
jgi:hypothetical protein